MNGRLFVLFLRSRLAGWGTLGLAVVALGFLLYGALWAGSAELGGIVAVVVPLLLTVLIVGTTRSPFGEPERAASRPLAPLRFGQLTGMAGVAALSLILAAFTWPDAESGSDLRWLLLRNLLGLLGLGLLAALPLGASLGWVAPSLVGFLALFTKPNDLSGSSHDALWTWPTRAADDTSALVIALLLVVLGLLAYTCQPLCETVEDRQ